MTDSFIIQPRGPASSAITTDASSVPLTMDPAFGPLLAHIDDTVTDVFVNGADGLFLDRGRGAEPAAGWRASEREVRDLAVALVGLGGRHLDDQAPCVDVRLDSGIRVHAVLAPVSTMGTALSIRIPRVRVADLDALAALEPSTPVSRPGCSGWSPSGRTSSSPEARAQARRHCCRRCCPRCRPPSAS